MKLTKIIKYIVAITIFSSLYPYTTVTLINTDNLILTELCKISFVIIATYIVMCALIPIGRFILKLIKK